MKTIKTAELTGAALDWAVAKCEGMLPHAFVEHDYGQGAHRPLERWCGIHITPGGHTRYEPSTDWAQGGPIIDREGISLRPIRKPGHELDGQCLAAIDHGNTGTLVQWIKRESFSRHYWRGPTPLIAAMRAFVASKLGDEVEVPEELLP